MSTPAQRLVNPFAVPGLPTAVRPPLCPWKFAEHLDYYLDIDDAQAQFEKFVTHMRALGETPSEGLLVFATGESGCGKTSLINRCVAWTARNLWSRGHIVDVSGRTDREAAMPIGDRFLSTCQRVFATLRELGVLAPRELDELGSLLTQPETFYRKMDQATGAPLLIILPPVDLVTEIVQYADYAGGNTHFFTESAYLSEADTQQVERKLLGKRCDFVSLQVGHLRAGDIGKFVADRLGRANGVFPGIAPDVIDELDKEEMAVARLQRTLYGAYEMLRVLGPQYSADYIVTADDIRRVVSGEPLTSPAGTPPGSVGTDVGWFSDAVTEVDLLKRQALAEVLADRILEAQQRPQPTSLLIHLDGAWGTGKSTLLGLLGKQLTDFPIVRFDAWQQSRLSPPWWALLTATRTAVTQGRSWWARRWLHIRELFTRARRSGGAYLLSLVLLLAVSGGLALLVRALVGSGPSGSELIKMTTSVVTAITVLWAGSKVASRILLWDSARGARLFEQSAINPMGRVAEHFTWLLKQTSKPVVFFIDDLDRCSHEYVVELLEAVQTLIREGSGGTRAAYIVVAADGNWLRRSFTTAYSEFAIGSGTSLGYQFMDKLFQLTVPMPALSSTAQHQFFGHLLGVTATVADPAAVAAARSSVQAATGDESQVLQALDTITEPGVRDLVAPDAARAVTAAETRIHTDHVLLKFSGLLSDNPREIKLFLNTYSMLRAVRTVEGKTPEPGVLALWSVVRVRWPAVADFLQRNPEAVEGIREPSLCAAFFPEELREAAGSKALRAVVCHTDGGPLTPSGIRRSSGTE